MPSEGAFPGFDVAVLLRKPAKYEVMLPQIVEMAEVGSGVDLISRARYQCGGRSGRSPPAPRREAAAGLQANPPAISLER
jgi:hypothetical protein